MKRNCQWKIENWEICIGSIVDLSNLWTNSIIIESIFIQFAFCIMVTFIYIREKLSTFRLRTIRHSKIKIATFIQIKCNYNRKQPNYVHSLFSKESKFNTNPIQSKNNTNRNFPSSICPNTQKKTVWKKKYLKKIVTQHALVHRCS